MCGINASIPQLIKAGRPTKKSQIHRNIKQSNADFHLGSTKTELYTNQDSIPMICTRYRLVQRPYEEKAYISLIQA